MTRHKPFAEATSWMSGAKYPTLGLSLATYVYLTKVLNGYKATPQAHASPILQKALDAAVLKLDKFFDKSTYESGTYYMAASA
jgi:hypothetical protein